MNCRGVRCKSIVLHARMLLNMFRKINAYWRIWDGSFKANHSHVKVVDNSKKMLIKWLRHQQGCCCSVDFLNTAVGRAVWSFKWELLSKIKKKQHKLQEPKCSMQIFWEKNYAACSIDCGLADEDLVARICLCCLDSCGGFDSVRLQRITNNVCSQ